MDHRRAGPTASSRLPSTAVDTTRSSPPTASVPASTILAAALVTAIDGQLSVERLARSMWPFPSVGENSRSGLFES